MNVFIVDRVPKAACFDKSSATHFKESMDFPNELKQINGFGLNENEIFQRTIARKTSQKRKLYPADTLNVPANTFF